MQGREAVWLAQGSPRPLGMVVAEEVAILAELGEIPEPKRIGIILAGDVFADSGETESWPVWRCLLGVASFCLPVCLGGRRGGQS